MFFQNVYHIIQIFFLSERVLTESLQFSNLIAHLKVGRINFKDNFR